MSTDNIKLTKDGMIREITTGLIDRVDKISSNMSTTISSRIDESDTRFEKYIEHAPYVFNISQRTEYIDIHYFYKDYPTIQKIDKGDWIDLYAAEDVIIPINQFRLIPLGISMKLPINYEAYIVPRSSTFKTWGIIQPNHMAVIDQSYSGTNDQWRFSAYCLQAKADGIYTDESDSKLFKYLASKRWGNWVLKHFCHRKYEDHRYTLIHKGDKICQFRIQEHMPTIHFEIKDKLSDEDRGGIGSTGTR